MDWLWKNIVCPVFRKYVRQTFQNGAQSVDVESCVTYQQIRKKGVEDFVEWCTDFLIPNDVDELSKVIEAKKGFDDLLKRRKDEFLNG